MNQRNSKSQRSERPPADKIPTGEPWDQIRTALAGLQFGTVTIIVQDGVIVQIERTEKMRLR